MKIHTYVLNLKRRTDRRRRMIDTLPSMLVPEFTSDWDFDTDWKKMNMESPHRFCSLPMANQI